MKFPFRETFIYFKRNHQFKFTEMDRIDTPFIKDPCPRRNPKKI